MSVAEKAHQARDFLRFSDRCIAQDDMGNHLGTTTVKKNGILFAARNGHVRGSDAYELKNPPDSPPQLARETAHWSEVAVERTHKSDQIEDKDRE